MTKSKGRGRKPQEPATVEAPSAITTVEATPEPSPSESVDDPRSKSDRVALWNSLTPADKRMVGIFTLEDFLKADDLTGFGPNSVFTIEEDRG